MLLGRKMPHSVHLNICIGLNITGLDIQKQNIVNRVRQITIQGHKLWEGIDLRVTGRDLKIRFFDKISANNI